MATIQIFNGSAYIDVKVTEEFAAQYADMEHKDALIERKETRRHQSLDRSMENGFDVADPRADIAEQAELRELSANVHNAIYKLTDKQRTVVLLHVLDGLSFREIGERLGLSRYTKKANDRAFALGRFSMPYIIYNTS